MSRPAESPEPEEISMKKLLSMKQQLGVPDPIWELIKDYADKGHQSETNAAMFFTDVSRNMVVRARRCRHAEGSPQFAAECQKVLRAFETKRDGYREYRRHWAPYLNSPLELWKRDYLLVWHEYSSGRLR